MTTTNGITQSRAVIDGAMTIRTDDGLELTFIRRGSGGMVIALPVLGCPQMVGLPPTLVKEMVGFLVGEGQL